jgi:ubiquinone/menaquinone biosynthesis C-methylase UbiE
MLSGRVKGEHGSSGRGHRFLSNLGELRFKMWLDANAEAVLREIGVRDGMRVLDYGCGSGRYTILSGKLVGVKGTVYALDINEKALHSLEKAVQSKGFKNITLIYYDEGSKIPINDGSLDLVLLIDVIQEVNDWRRLFEDLLRLLKQEGVLAVFPMHVDAESVVNAVVASGSRYEGKTVRERFLLFTRSRDM